MEIWQIASKMDVMKKLFAAAVVQCVCCFVMMGMGSMDGSVSLFAFAVD